MMTYGRGLSFENTISYGKFCESDLQNVLQVIALCEWDRTFSIVYLDEDFSDEEMLSQFPPERLLTVSCPSPAQFNELIETVAEFHQDKLFTE